MTRPETPRNQAEETFEKLFIEGEIEGQKWKEDYYKALAAGDSETLESLIEEAREVGDVYKNDNEINNFISYFTSSAFSYGDMMNKIVALESLPEIDKVEYNAPNGVLKIYTKNGYVKGDLITVNLLSKSLRWLRYDEEITSLTRRVGQCHHRSLELADNLKYELNLSPTIVTGQASSLAEKCSVLHTWLEVQIQGKPYVLDYTMNALIDKDAYYKIKHVKANETCRIDYGDYMYDKPIIRPFLESKELKYKQYLFFRDEIMRDLKGEQKNSEPGNV